MPCRRVASRLGPSERSQPRQVARARSRRTGATGLAPTCRPRRRAGVLVGSVHEQLQRPAPDVPAKAPSCPCPSSPPLVSARPSPPLKAAVKVLPVRALPVLFARVNGRGVVSVPSLFASLSASLFASLFATRRCSAASTAAEPRAHHVARGRRVDTACQRWQRREEGAWRGITDEESDSSPQSRRVAGNHPAPHGPPRPYRLNVRRRRQEAAGATRVCRRSAVGYAD